MDIFLHNLPPQATVNDLHRFFEPILRSNGIPAFQCSPLRRAGCAILTLLRREDGVKFLRIFQDGLQYQAKTIYCKPSHSEPDEWLLKSMHKTLNDSLKPKQRIETPKATHTKEFAVHTLACGLWDYEHDDLVFVSYFEDDTSGSLKFEKHNLEVYLEDRSSGNAVRQNRLDIPYNTIQSITTGNGQCPSLTFSLTEAPRMYVSNEEAQSPFESAASDIEQLLKNLRLAGQSTSHLQKADVIGAKQKWKRICHLGKNHHLVVATCLVYRVILLKASDLQRISMLENESGREVPPIVSWPARSSKPAAPFHTEVSILNQKLARLNTSFPFGLKFQLQKLNQNGCLPPSKVLALLPEVQKLVRRSGVDRAIQAVKKLTAQIPFPGPGTQAKDLDHDGLVRLIKDLDNLIGTTGPASIQHSNERLCLVYKAIVTPAGIYLFGPDLEVGNRVLRQYPKSASQFLRVSFLDEDLEPIRFDANASNREVFSRFRTKLGGVINIAGQGFEFLGYSHSSLRSQTCWYMAPHTHEKSLLHARALIAKLGDFSAIRSPAKCAARIGQAFSDTTAAIRISKEAVQIIPDIERSGRVFSDGVGTMSKAVLERILMEYPTYHDIPPIAFQIRFAGLYKIGRQCPALTTLL